MTLLFAFILGILQGLTEFLPISSSGHLALARNIFGMESMNVLVHIGTLISVCIVFRRDIWRIIKGIAGLFTVKHRKGGNVPVSSDTYFSVRLLLLLVVATLPLFAVIFIKDYIEALYYNTAFIGFSLIITGGILYISDRIIEGRKNEKSAKMSDGFVIGLIQAIAVLPGLSRSGTTITTGLFCGFTREFAVKFSFLMSIPAMLGASIIGLVDAIGTGIDWKLVPAYILGIAAAAISGLFAIRVVKALVNKGKLGKFAYYCWTVGLIAILVSFFI